MKEKTVHAAEAVTTTAPAVDSGMTTAVAEHAAWLHSADTWIAVSFVLFIALFVKFALPKINASLDDRANKIRDQLEQAARLRAEAQALLASYQQQQQEAMKEAESIIASAQRDAADMRTRAVDELKTALDRRSQQAQEKIARAEVEAIEQIRKTIITTATESAREIVATQLQSQTDDQAVTRALAAIERQIH
ncbi:MAG: F0F1 ATP synthase subunit B [Pseudomonadota bacterium]